MTSTAPQPGVMVDEARYRTRVIRCLKEREGEPCTVDEIARQTGLRPQEVLAGIEHNHFVDNLRPNLYYGVIEKIDRDGRTTYRFNRVQYLRNRSRWIDAGGRGGARRGGGGGLEWLSMPRFGWLRRKGKGGE